MLIDGKLMYGGKFTGGLSGTPTHRAWVNMRQRCLNTRCYQYTNYGGRGITICNEWSIFENFLKDMGFKKEGLSLERRNNSLGYCKENCYWATRSEQQQNRRSVKLSKQIAKDIRASNASTKILASQYKVSISTINLIREGKTWK